MNNYVNSFAHHDPRVQATPHEQSQSEGSTRLQANNPENFSVVACWSRGSLTPPSTRPNTEQILTRIGDKYGCIQFLNFKDVLLNFIFGLIHYLDVFRQLCLGRLDWGTSEKLMVGCVNSRSRQAIGDLIVLRDWEAILFNQSGWDEC